MEVTVTESRRHSGFRHARPVGNRSSECAAQRVTTVRTLNAQNIADREFAVVRDPESQKFVIRVIDRTTGDVIDQFPPEDILKLLSQFKPANEPNQGSDKMNWKSAYLESRILSASPLDLVNILYEHAILED